MPERFHTTNCKSRRSRGVRDVVAMQEEIGLHSITDGEFRRQTYLERFLDPIGVELLAPEKR